MYINEFLQSAGSLFQFFGLFFEKRFSLFQIVIADETEGVFHGSIEEFDGTINFTHGEVGFSSASI